MILLKNNAGTLNLLDSIFDNFFDDEVKTTSTSKVPIHDIIENDDEYQIEALLAGVKKDDINIDIEKNVLKITAERKAIDDVTYNRKQSYFGKYERLFELPDDVDVDNIKATLVDGILTLKIPKQEELKDKKMKIEIT